MNSRPDSSCSALGRCGEPTFHPWEGPLYRTTGWKGIRLLIVGESHYGGPEESCPTFTQQVIQDRAIDGRHRFFTILMRTVMGNRCAKLDPGEREDFWSRVAFYNFVQDFPGAGARIRPTEQMWERATRLFPKVIEKTEPHLLLVTGKILASRVPSIGYPLHRCEIRHPAWPGFRYDDSIVEVRKAMALTRQSLA